MQKHFFPRAITKENHFFSQDNTIKAPFGINKTQILK